MINFDNIENSLRHEIADDNGDGSCVLTNTALLELITRLRQAEKDAARYRWLRDSNSDYSVCSVLAKQESEWNSAIDEAMQCK